MAAEKKKRERKANFSDGEVAILLEEIRSNRELIMSQISTSIMLKKKKEMWIRISHKVSAFSTTQRSAKDVRKKWHDLKTAVLNTYKTGPPRMVAGGSSARKPMYAEAIVAIVLDKDHTESGLNVAGEDSWVSANIAPVEGAINIVPLCDPSSTAPVNGDTLLTPKIEWETISASPSRPTSRCSTISDQSDADAYNSTSTAKRKLPVPVTEDDNLRNEWLREEIKTNKKKQTYFDSMTEYVKLKKKKLELEIAKLERESP